MRGSCWPLRVGVGVWVGGRGHWARRTPSGTAVASRPGGASPPPLPMPPLGRTLLVLLVLLVLLLLLALALAHAPGARPPPSFTPPPCSCKSPLPLHMAAPSPPAPLALCPPWAPQAAPSTACPLQCCPPTGTMQGSFPCTLWSSSASALRWGRSMQTPLLPPQLRSPPTLGAPPPPRTWCAPVWGAWGALLALCCPWWTRQALGSWGARMRGPCTLAPPGWGPSFSPTRRLQSLVAVGTWQARSFTLAARPRLGQCSPPFALALPRRAFLPCTG